MSRFQAFKSDEAGFGKSTSSFRSSLSATMGSHGVKRKALDDVMEGFDSFMRATSSLGASTQSQRTEREGRVGLDRSPNLLGRSVASNGSERNPSDAVLIDPQLLVAQREAADLKRKLSEVSKELEERIIKLERKNATAQAEIAARDAKLQKADADVRFLVERDKEQSRKLKEVEDELSNSRTQDSSTMNNYSRANHELKERLRNVEMEFEEFKRRSAHEMKRASLSHEQSQSALKQQLEFAVEAKENLARKVETLHSNLNQLQESRSVKPFVSNNDMDPILTKQLQDQLKYIRELEESKKALTAEVSRLRSSKENVERLKEEKAAIENELEDMADLRKKLGQSEVLVSTLNAEKKRWMAFLEHGDETGIDSPYELSKALASLRLELASRTEKAGMDQARIKGMETYIADLERQLNAAVEDASAISARYDGALRNLKRTEKSKELLQKEISFLRDQLSAYDLEEENMSSNFDAIKSARISELEKLLDESKEVIKKLESHNTDPIAPSVGQQPSAAQYSPSAAQRIRDMEDEILALQRAVKLLEKERQSLDDQVGMLERSLGRGEYNEAKTRILQLSENPESQEFSIRTEYLSALRAENVALRAKFLDSSANPTAVPVQSLEAAECLCRQLETKLSDKDIRIARLKEVYAIKAQEYREAVFSLLGYKVDFQEGRVMLSSTYADPGDPMMLFTSGPNDTGTLQLVGGNPDRLAKFQKGRQHYVDERGSVPAFLASITLGGWERSHIRG